MNALTVLAVAAATIVLYAVVRTIVERGRDIGPGAKRVALMVCAGSLCLAALAVVASADRSAVIGFGLGGLVAPALYALIKGGLPTMRHVHTPD